ncbi:hypothetical protein [Streptomyces pacificus]|uniref:LmbE family protein n=1 Tax=Streptomyces pacificus TaxID=2705029 RepID=A0A6A0AZD5_9ACTN|nr:hypothetical protein [Streptomyces pacificus]GFH37828.1 hypothetical protein SCWH03_40680 [Streptomyces pacificus]
MGAEGGKRGAARVPAPLPADPSLPPTAGWLLRGKDGRLSAYTPAAGGVLRWTEKRPGGPGWTGPELFPAPGLLPYLAIAQGADGYVQLVGLRRTPMAGGEVATDVVQAIQYQSGRPMRDWYALGTPYAQDRALAATTGLPSAVVDAEGSLHVFVRNSGGGVCGRAQVPNGRWNKWADLKGSGTLGPPAAAVTDHGLMEVLAPTEEAVLRWDQEARGVKFRRAAGIASSAADGCVCSERTGPERLTHFWRDAAKGAVHAWREGMAAPALLGSEGGSGPPAVLRTPVDGQDCTILAQRGADGRPVLAAYPTEKESALDWAPTGEPCVGAPALAVDGTGRVVLAALGADGTLRVTRQESGSGLAMEAWTRV